MKRKTAAYALTLCLMGAVLMTGCGKNVPEVDASKNEDLSAKVTDQNKVEDSADAFQKFLDAQKAMEGADSATISSELLISMTDEGKKNTQSQRFDIKRMTSDGKQAVEFTMKNAATAYKEDGTVDEENSNSRELPGYFYDGMLYYTQTLSETEGDSVKLKEEITYEDLMSVIGSTYILNDITADQVETTATNSKNGGTEYIYILSKDAVSEYMLGNLEASGVSFGEDGGVDINYANISAEIDKDGFLTSYTFSVDAIIRDETGEVPFSYNIASIFTDINATSVAVKSDEELADHITTDEYAKQLQEEQQEIENMPVDESAAEGSEETQTEDDGNIVITPENAEDYGIELTEDQTASVTLGE